MADSYHLKPDHSVKTAGMNPQDAFFVTEGVVRIFVVKKDKNTATTTPCLAEISSGYYFPSLSYTEDDGTVWEFDIKAKGESAMIERKTGTATGHLKRRFLEDSGLPGTGKDSFEGCIVNWVAAREMKDFLTIIKTTEGNEQYEERGAEIASGNPEEDRGRLADSAKSNLNYAVLRYLCQCENIELASEEKILSICDAGASIPEIAEASDFLCREVFLVEDWYRNDCGCLVCTIDDTPVACYPKHAGQYIIYDAKTGTERKLTAEIAETLSPNAYSIGRALPKKSLVSKELWRFASKSLREADITALLLLGLIGSLIGLLLPTMNQQIYDDYIPLGDINPMLQFGIVIATFMIGNLFFTLVKNMMEFCVSSRVGYDLQNAVYHRLFHLPEPFFRTIDSADLAQRAGSIKTVTIQYVNSIIVTGFSMLFSLVFLFRMVSDSGKLTIISLLMLVAYAAVVFLISAKALSFGAKVAELDGRSTSKLFQYLSGIDKIRMAGSENRALYEYLIPFAETQSQTIKRNRISSVGAILSGMISSVFSMVLYYLIVHDKIGPSVGRFMAFNTAFGSFSSAVLSLIDVGIQLYALKPIVKRMKPLMEMETEDCGESSTQKAPPSIYGHITLDRVSFGYSKDTSVLNDFSLAIEPGEYIGIVGPSGCGKSTLIKLLLGFEKPVSGNICYDTNDLAQMNKRAFRRKLGVVLQNGALISGSIFENITITNRRATLSDVNHVLEKVGLMNDISGMPMGVHTMVSEGGGMLSGGQVQRILIARAILGNPRILLLDEATSALDNVTQKMVCDSLDAMNITRVVIAHRLSTIEKCHRIVYLKNGNIAELGTYSQLMEMKGEFYQMAQRQLFEEGDADEYSLER